MMLGSRNSICNFFRV